MIRSVGFHLRHINTGKAAFQTFMPVRTLEVTNSVAAPPEDPAPMLTPRSSSARSPSHAGMIEMELGDGRRIRVDNDVNLVALRRVLQALRT